MLSINLFLSSRMMFSNPMLSSSLTLFSPRDSNLMSSSLMLSRSLAHRVARNLAAGARGPASGGPAQCKSVPSPKIRACLNVLAGGTVWDLLG